MKYITRLFNAIKQHNLDSNEYFSHYQSEITLTNVLLLKRLSYLAGILLVTYFATMSSILYSKILVIIYCIFILIHVGFIIFADQYSKKSVHKHTIVQNVCFCFLISLLCFTTIVSIIPFPDNPAIFFPLFLVLLASLFILPNKHVITLFTLFEIIFLILSYIFKSADAFSYDFTASITACLFAIIVLSIISDLRFKDSKSKTALKHLCATDELTKISNKATAEYLCRTYLKDSGKVKPSVLFIIDIDDFKTVNDTMGHQFGDMVLSKIGNTLRLIFRDEDIVGRIGGDEFMVLMKNTSDTAIIENKALKLQENIKSISAGEANTFPTCSIGIAINNAVIADFDTLFMQADKALYLSKGKGKNQFVVFSANDGIILDSEKSAMLIVDRSKTIRAILSEDFVDEFIIIEADNGEKALSLLNKYSTKISVILIDTISINGLALLEEIRNNPQFIHISILTITDNLNNEFLSLELGATDIINKPINPVVMRRRVDSAVNRTHGKVNSTDKRNKQHK